MIEKNDWKLQGSYFETCNCETACPCVWLQAPSEGDCKLLVAWHIETGHFAKQTLGNLNVALACYAPGHMKDGDWQAALYVDERADDAQFDAITQIFSGQQGGHLAILMSFVSEVLGIQKVNIDYQENGIKRMMAIPGIAQAEIESIQGITGGESSISNPPLCVVSSHPSTVAKSNHYQYQDFDKDWQFSDRNGYYSPFTYQP
ncbi:MAG: DUF1326 domain-containing protein [Gammaproteobacteria bacterium]|jgi:hypothetical protein|nr:DUF1326 domain-containing protein [Gammaproteobacteria bacterium]MBT4145720.1 DUF1326 domain-containing protein [Gammaproteobacteria bacterium]MBT5222836.1 DUF1326 domain-containing protein [Gammaproteobacteria bacterium]MBT5826096.1 DUF1326 domain-containing protein [Gammaproteobacteria bacterium]MBT5965974.1 DUF1326 domain-containing protein [Gammaproteobacteria bacterium]